MHKIPNGAVAAGNEAIALLANAGATAGILYGLIVVFGPVSGAHFNPAVTLVMAVRRALGWELAAAYVAVQLLGAQDAEIERGVA